MGAQSREHWWRHSGLRRPSTCCSELEIAPYSFCINQPQHDTNLDTLQPTYGHEKSFIFYNRLHRTWRLWYCGLYDTAQCCSWQSMFRMYMVPSSSGFLRNIPLPSQSKTTIWEIIACSWGIVCRARQRRRKLGFEYCTCGRRHKTTILFSFSSFFSHSSISSPFSLFNTPFFTEITPIITCFCSESEVDIQQK